MILNREELCSHSCIEGRRTALDLVESVLQALDPYSAANRKVKLDGSILQVEKYKIDLDWVEDIYVIGAGKATYPIARALEEILPDRISGGIIILKKGRQEKLKRIKIVEASHPIPDKMSLEGAKEIINLVKEAGPKDLVFSLITGGSSALMCYPPSGISLEEKQELNRVLLHSGVDIFGINAVRKHISRIKGGRLAEYIFPAVLVNLTVSDVIGDRLDYITGPTVSDTSTIEDALQVFDRYRLWDEIPENVGKYFRNLGPEDESPKKFDKDAKMYNTILVKTKTVTDACQKRAEELGLNALVLSSCFDGESSALGRAFVCIAREIIEHGQPMERPCVLIGGGETTVKIEGTYGLGGPNQEFVMGAAVHLGGLNDVVIAGLDTDGTDGPTDIAGALADVQMINKAEKLGISLNKELRRHNVTPVFERLGSAIRTGATGTNVNDLKFLLIL